MKCSSVHLYFMLMSNRPSNTEQLISSPQLCKRKALNCDHTHKSLLTAKGWRAKAQLTINKIVTLNLSQNATKTSENPGAIILLLIFWGTIILPQKNGTIFSIILDFGFFTIISIFSILLFTIIFFVYYYFNYFSYLLLFTII